MKKDVKEEDPMALEEDESRQFDVEFVRIVPIVEEKEKNLVVPEVFQKV